MPMKAKKRGKAAAAASTSASVSAAVVENATIPTTTVIVSTVKEEPHLQKAPQDEFTALLPQVPVPVTAVNVNGVVNNGQAQQQKPTAKKSRASAASTSAVATAQNADAVVAHCQAEVVSTSLKALRGKGSSFLRTHASKHGITNASRKLTGQVLNELTEHYTRVHGVEIVADGMITSAPATTTTTVTVTPVAAAPSADDIVARLSNGNAANKVVTLNGGGTQIVQQQQQQPQVVHIQLPQHPLPQQIVLQQPPQQPQPQIQFVSAAPQQQQQQQVTVTTIPTAIAQIQHPLKQEHVQQQQQQQHVIVFPTQPLTPPGTTSVTNTMAGGSVMVVQQQPPQPQHHRQPKASHVNGNNAPASANGGAGCSAALMAKTRNELASCGTSLLRPEAAAHKVHNASRKPKEQVVDELWQHYQTCHAKELSVNGANGHEDPLAINPPASKRARPVKTTIAQVAEAAAIVGQGEGWVGDVVDDEDDKN